MPEAIGAAVISGVIAGAAEGAIAGMTAFATTFFVGAATSIVNQGLRKSQPSGQSLTTTIKNPAAARRVIYGTRRVGGVLVHATTTDDDKYVHMVIAMASHECEAISDIWLNDKPLTDYGTYGKKPSATVTWGGVNGSTFATIEVPATLSVTVNGDTYNDSDAAGLESQLEAEGFTCTSSDATNVEVRHEIYADMSTLEITVADVNDTLTVTSSNGRVDNYAGDDFPVVYEVFLGASDQTANANMISYMDDWDADNRLRGIAGVYVRLRNETGAFPNGLPNVTALVQGKNDIYDPRGGGSTGYTANAALCVADFLCNEKFGFGADFATEIDSTTITAAANECDEEVVLEDTSTEYRYECHGVIDTGVAPKENLEAMLSSMAGTAVYSGGLWYIRAGAYETPTITLDESDLRDSIKIQTKLSRTELCNGVRGTYYGVENNYQESDFPAVTNATYYGEDDDERIWKNVDYKFTTSYSMAQRLAKIALEESRQGITVDYPCKLTALNTICGGTVYVDNTRLGWSSKSFRITDWRFAISDGGGLGIDLMLRETASGIYDWNNGEETTVDLAPNTTLPSPWIVQPVTDLDAATDSFFVDEGVIQHCITVTFTASTTPGATYLIELIRAGDEVVVRRVETKDTTYTLSDVRGGVIYIVRVTAINPHWGYARSKPVLDYIGLIDWTDPTYTRDQETTPSDVTGLQVVGGGTSWTGRDCPIEWDDNGEYFVTRYKIVVKTSGDVTLRTDYVPASIQTYTYTLAMNTADNAGTPIRTLKFYLTALDKYDNESSTPTSITATNPAPDMSSITPTTAAGPTYAAISWTHPSGEDLDYYLLYWDTSSPPTGGDSVKVSYPETVREIFGLSYGTTYYFQIVPYDVFGAGTASQIVSENPNAIQSEDVDVELQASVSWTDSDSNNAATLAALYDAIWDSGGVTYTDPVNWSWVECEFAVEDFINGVQIWAESTPKVCVATSDDGGSTWNYFSGNASHGLTLANGQYRLTSRADLATAKTNYWTLSAGYNYAFLPNGTTATNCRLYIDATGGYETIYELVFRRIVIAEDIATESLSAIIADIGTITAGIIQSADYDGMGDGIKIDIDNGKYYGDFVIQNATGYSAITDAPADLGDLDSAADTKLSSIAAGATVGATWGTNLNSIPDRLDFDSAAELSGEAAGLYLTADYMGYWTGSAFSAYIRNNGYFKFEKDANNFIAYEGSTLGIKMQGDFYLSSGDMYLQSSGTINLASTTGIVVNDGADILMENAGSNPAYIGFEDSTGTAVMGIQGATSANRAQIYPFGSTYTKDLDIGISAQRWDDINIYSDTLNITANTQINLGGKTVLDNGANLYFEYSTTEVARIYAAGATSSTGDFRILPVTGAGAGYSPYLYLGTSTAWYRIIIGGTILPYVSTPGDSGYNIGSSSAYHHSIYGYDYYYKTGAYTFDKYDDVGLLLETKSNINEHGIEVLDLSTLPDEFFAVDIDEETKTEIVNREFVKSGAIKSLLIGAIKQLMEYDIDPIEEVIGVLAGRITTLEKSNAGAAEKPE